MSAAFDDFPALDDMLDTAVIEPPSPTEQTNEGDAPKRTRKKRSDAGQPRGARGPRAKRGGLNAADKKLADELLNPWAKICSALAMFAPTVSGVMAMRGEASMQGLVSLASPKMKEALGNVAKTGPGLDLVETLLMMVVAIGVDFGKVNPDSPVAMLTGVRNIYDEMHPEKKAERQAPAQPEQNGHAPSFDPFPATAFVSDPFPGAVA